MASILREGFHHAICFLHYLGRAGRVFPVCGHLDKLFHLAAMATGELAVAFHPPEIQHEDILFLGNKTVRNNTV